MRFSRIYSARILLATVTLALFSLYGYYYAREWMAKWAFAHQSYFSADELVLITVAKADLTTENAYLLNEGEYEWQGDMVDVLHREIRSDSVYVYGFRDEAETTLRHEAAWLYKRPARNDPFSDTAAKRVKWFCPFILPGSAGMDPLVRPVLPAAVPFFSYTSPRIQLPQLDIPSPPPNL
ncbi:hypothetical protein [Spirosoma pollinicola]|uniref:Uncharacterized protein n=1 Tax=Spirosoma pollinicola TaxID=2057025 RepID=A0A2K8Z1B2_9BACT|nr:hypothetical protein [Spirosoma pollinicola]AUD03629.1 hypothetical protein CWM47_18430 [Spirosoma pollinicola]